MPSSDLYFQFQDDEVVPEKREELIEVYDDLTERLQDFGLVSKVGYDDIHMYIHLNIHIRMNINIYFHIRMNIDIHVRI
jgi:hypothetical protein